MAVVALGGCEASSARSDVDLMLLHDVGDGRAAADLFRPYGTPRNRRPLRSYTVRKPRMLPRRFDTQTTLLTSRLVAGSEELFAS